MKLLGFLVAIVYVPFIRQAATAPRWAILALGLGIMLPFMKDLKISWWIFTILAWAAISLLWAPLLFDGVNSLFKLGLLCIVFAFGAREEGSGTMKWIGWGVAASSLLAIGQFFGWHPIEEVASPSGTFANKNFLAEAALLCIIPAIANKQYLLVATLSPSLVITGSRGTWTAIGILIAIWLWKKDRRLALLLGGQIAAALLFFAFDPSLRHYVDADQRFEFWADSLQGVNFWGRGIGQFYGLFPQFATHVETMQLRPDHAHNEAIEWLFEGGVPIIVTGAGFLYRVLLGPLRWQSYVLIATLAIGCFSFPLHNPVTGMVAFYTAGSLWAICSRIRRIEHVCAVSSAGSYSTA